jgi:hypothetical protein
VKAVGGLALGLVLLVAGGLVTVLMAIGGANASAPVNPYCATDANLAAILATIRTVETGGNYTTTITTSTASGAYAFLDSAWGGFGGYQRAAHAPPAVQDQKAAELARTVLAANNGDVGAVPVSWYLGHVPAAASSEWDQVPRPDAGNRLTPRQYQTKWLAEYARQQHANPAATAAGSGCVTDTNTYAGGPLPPVLDCQHITWGGYANGRIPHEAMRYRPTSGYLHPAASESFDQLYAAAQQAGFDLRGSGYRPASAGGATAGRSCSGLGLAVDIAVLTGDPDTAFASPEFTWLCSNAERYGWITPRNALPAGRVCGTVTGTGRGGWRGNQCCFLEAWHIEAAGVVTTDPNFVIAG